MHGYWRKLTEGLYVDGRGAAHLRLGELLRAARYQDNEMNRETPQRAAVEIYRKTGMIQVFEVED